MALGADRFSRDDAKEIVTDNDTKLQWQDNTEANSTKKYWSDAITYCEGLDLGGYDDWRLPNVKELLSITDDKRYDPAIDPTFKYVNSDSYFSSTTTAYFNNVAWTVHFLLGSAGHDGAYKDERDDNIDKYDKYEDFVRCVRSK